MAPSFNANKLKVQLKLSSTRLRMLQQKKAAQNAVFRREIAQLLEKHKLESARIRVRRVPHSLSLRAAATTEALIRAAPPRPAPPPRPRFVHASARSSMSFARTTTRKHSRSWSCTAKCCLLALASSSSSGAPRTRRRTGDSSSTG